MVEISKPNKSCIFQVKSKQSGVKCAVQMVDGIVPCFYLTLLRTTIEQTNSTH